MYAQYTRPELAGPSMIVVSPSADRSAGLRRQASETQQAALWTRLRSALFGWIERERARNELARLTDRELADIGISRSDIPAVIARHR